MTWYEFCLTCAERHRNRGDLRMYGKYMDKCMGMRLSEAAESFWR